MPNSSGLRISLLGEIAISIDGAPITNVATRKAEGLLVYLTCNPQPHRREVLSELLWDDLSPERALGNLRLVLNQLRAHFAGFLAISRYTVAIRANANYWLDVDAFARGLTSDPAGADAALALYRGDFLQGFHLRDARGFSEWQHNQAEHWRRVATEGMHGLVEYHTAWSKYAQGLAWARHLLALDPLDEAAHRHMILLLARSGRRHAALRQYQSAAERLQTELGIDPEPATTALYQRILAGPAQRPHNLPPHVGPQIGRAAEMARVYTWLAAAKTRLLTITGSGGSGKTHLALSAGRRAASELIGPCNDGVFYLALVGYGTALRVSDDDLLIALAQVLGVQLVPREPPAEQVGRYLQERELLLIVDNGELLTPRARLALSTLLSQAPALRLLVPSRERLKLREEHVLELDGLSYPEQPAPTAVAMTSAPAPQLARYAAVQLLLHHTGQEDGAAAIASYSVANQHALGQICQLVHGLPLAIELAAPWLALCSPQELLRSIAATIDVLQVDAPDLPERHRSIRAVFEYSWRLLSPAETQALAGLGVFPAGFTAGAAEAIVGAGLATLGALRDKSLVQALKLEPETRYALHPLLQRFALEKLQTNPEVAAAVCTRHAHYFAAFAHERKPLLYGPDSVAAMNDIEREFANLRAGWHWAATGHDLATLGAYSIPLHDFCALRGWKLESTHLFEAGAAAARAWAAGADPDEATALAAVRILACHAELQQIMGDIAAAEQAYHDCRILLNAIAAEDAPELLFVYKQIGLLAYGRGVYPEAMQCLRLTLAIAEEGAEVVRVADTLLSIGAVALAQGEWATAEQALRRGLAIYDDLHYAWGRGHTLRFLGTLALIADDRAAADTYLHASLETARQIDNRIGVALALDQIGLLHLAEQQFDASAAALREALALFQTLGVELGIGRALVHLGRLALAQAQPDLARQQLGQALLIAERLPSPPLLIECAAVTLQLGLNNTADLVLTPATLAATLVRHPACTAETRRYLAALAGTLQSGAHHLPVPDLQELVPTLRALLTDGGLARAIQE